METNTAKSSVIAGKLTKTHFATEQERLEEFAKSMSVSTQAAEAVNGRDGQDGNQGPQGPAGQDGSSPEPFTQIEEVVNPTTSGDGTTITGIPSPADVFLKLIWTGAVPPSTARAIGYVEITGTDTIIVHLDGNVTEDGWMIYASTWAQA